MPNTRTSGSRGITLSRVGFTFCVLSGLSGSASAETMPASEFSERASSALQRIRNVSFDVTWDNSIDGRPTDYSILKTTSDSLGRIRVIDIEKGTYGRGGSKVPSRKGRDDKLFDGEKSVVLSTFDDLDASGKPIVAPGGIYRNAVITDPSHGGSRWRTFERNPLTLGSNLITRRLERRAKLDDSVSVTNTEYDGDEAVVASFRQDDHEIKATFVPSQSWAIRKFAESDSLGKVIRQYEAKYARVNDGFWLPAEGISVFDSPKVTMQTELPKGGEGGDPAALPRLVLQKDANIVQVYQWRFHISNLKVNDPSFDDSVFSVSLPEHTVVSDNRFKTLYRVGEAKAAEADLTKLALDAKQHPDRGLRMPRDKSPGSHTSIGWIILGSLGVAVVLVVAALAGKRALYR